MPDSLRHCRHRADPRGFSLVEIVIVVALVGVVMAIAAPRYGRSMSRYQVDSAARRIAADLTLAQARARMTSARLAVTFDPTKGQYSAPLPDPDHPGSSSYTVDLTSAPYRVSLVSVSFGSTAGATLEFDGFGTPSGGGVVTVQAGDLQRTVTVDAGTGAIAVQ